MEVEVDSQVFRDRPIVCSGAALDPVMESKLLGGERGRPEEMAQFNNAGACYLFPSYECSVLAKTLEARVDEWFDLTKIRDSNCQDFVMTWPNRG